MSKGREAREAREARERFEAAAPVSGDADEYLTCMSSPSPSTIPSHLLPGTGGGQWAAATSPSVDRMQCIASAVCRASWCLGWRRCEANGGTPRLCAAPLGGDRRNGAMAWTAQGGRCSTYRYMSVQAIYAGRATTPPAMRPARVDGEVALR